MNTLQSALCLLLGSAIPLAALFFFVRRAMRQLQVASAYGEVSRQLGLDVDTRGVSLQGHLGDRRIWIGEVMVGHGPERRMVTWGVLDLTRPLALGLVVRRRGRSLPLLRGRAAPDAAIGDPALDRLLHVQGDEPDRVRALFTPPVRQALRTLMDAWPEIAITDRAVRVHLSRPEASAERLHLLVSAMLGLAEALEAARAQVAAPSRLDEVVQNLRATAERLGLDLEPAFPALSGQLEGRRVLVAARRDQHGYSAVVRLWFRPHPATGLRLRPQTEPDGYWSVGQDIQFQDPGFDGRFVIKGWDPEQIRELLGPDARAALVELLALGAVAADDRCLDVEGVALEPGSCEAALSLATRVAERLGW